MMAEQLQPSETLQPFVTISTNEDRAKSQIYVDDHGVHDFDFKNRNSNNGSHRLRKLGGRRHVRNSSSMTDIERKSSSASDKSIRMRFSTFLGGLQGQESPTNDCRGDKHCQRQRKDTNNSIHEREDPLPDTKKDLEIRLNYHLSELDMLKQTIRAANDVVLQQQERYLILDTRSTSDMQESMKRQAELVQLARTNRNAYASFVGYHRHQIERIKHKRVGIELAAGLDPTLPDVYKTMWSDEDWAFLFKV